MPAGGQLIEPDMSAHLAFESPRDPAHVTFVMDRTRRNAHTKISTRRMRAVITVGETSMRKNQEFRTAMRDLTKDELDLVGGGMKYDPNYVSKDVVDARGGQFTILGVTVSFDTTGKVTSVGRTA